MEPLRSFLSGKPKSIGNVLAWIYRWRMFRYLASGGGCAVLEYCLLVWLYGGLDWNVHAANITALVSASVVNYFLNRYWVFGKSDREIHFEFILFVGVTLSSMALNHAMFIGFLEGLGWDYRLAKLCAIVLVISFNYSAKKYLVFRNGSLG